MKIMKRIVGLLLCLAMVLSFVPVTHTHVHAAETVQPGTTTETGDIVQGSMLEIVSPSNLSAVFGCYSGHSTSGTFNDGNDGVCLVDGWYYRSAYSGFTPNNGLVAAVITLDSATTIGGLELVGNDESGHDPTEISIEVYNSGTWTEVVAPTEDVFDSTRTKMYTFNPTVAEKVRVLVHDSENNGVEVYLGEISLFEAKTGNVSRKIDLTGKSSATELVDGNKANYYTGNNIEIDLTNGGQPTSIDRFALYLTRPDDKSYVPLASTVTISIKKTAGGSYESIGTFNTNWSNKEGIDSVFEEFDQTYEAYALKIAYDKNAGAAEFELYQYERGASEPGEPGTTTVGAGWTRISLSKSNILGACSTGNTQGYIDDGDFTNPNLKWYFKGFPNNTEKNWDYWFDRVYTNEAHWGVTAGQERADFLLDLSNGGKGTTINRVLVSKGNHSYTIPSNYHLVLVLKDGTQVTKEFTTGWTNSTANGKTYTYDLDQAYTVEMIYVWAENCTGNVAFGEFELWQKTQLPAPKNLQTTAVTSDSITVAANTVSAGGRLEFSRDGINWYPADGYSYTFTGLDADTDYTIQARYFATADGYVTTVTPATIEVTTEATAKEPLADPTITSVTTTDSTITVNATAAAGKLMYCLKANDGALVADWQESNVFTGLHRNTGYDVYVKCIPTDDNYAESKEVIEEVTTAKTKLSAPANLKATEITDTSITVTADAADGTLRFRINGGDWTTEPTFTGLKYSTTYKIDALYTANGMPDFLDSEVSSITVTTSSCAHAYDNACDADCNECGEIRVPADHVYDNKYDADCNECGEIRSVPEVPTVNGDLSDLTVMPELPTPQFGYYTDNNTDGIITDYYQSSYPPSNLTNNDTTDNGARSEYYLYSEIASGEKIPAILFNLGEEKTLGGIEIYGWKYSYYNIEIFDVQVYVDGAWKTVAAAYDAFVGDNKNTQFEEADASLEMRFDDLYTTSQVRILINGITDMTDFAYEDGPDDDELVYGSYFRVREIKLYEGVNTCEHEYDNACDADCNLCGETRVPSDHVYTDCADDTCNVCSEKRTAPGHKFDNCDDTQCNQCTATREPLQHQYENACDVDCNECGAIREVEPHEYTDACDVDCNICFEEREAPHVYDNACDTECNNCGATREGSHVYDNDCDADCNICHYLRPDATGHKYDNECDEICNNCNFVREAKHVYDDCDDTSCNKCSAEREPLEHVYKNECDPDCDVCHKNREGMRESHVYTDACDSTCDKCNGHRNAPHVFSSIYDPDCDVCGATRPVQEEPDVPDYPDREKIDLSMNAPVFGYYSDRNTNGPITDCYEEGYGPNLLVDGIRVDPSKKNRATSEPYYYADVRQGVKIPVILFNFGETVNLCSVDIYGYAYNYYNIETFDVQVYTDGEWLNVAHITNAFTDGEFEEQVETPLTVNFDKPYEATQLRILVRSVTDMTGKGDITTGDDEFGYAAPFRIKEIEIYQLEMSDDVYLTEAELNGIDIGDYKIIYSDDEPDYNYRAAEYLQKIIKKKTGRDMEIVEASEGKYTYEILVGDTDRDLSVELTPPANRAMKFAIQADNSKIALEADYFIIAAAAYYFGEEIVPDETETSKTVSTDKQELEPIVHEPNNYIMLIGDGMGVNQTKLFDVYDVTESQFTSVMDISDDEDIFYGYYFPYEGRSHTSNYLGQITDSGAGGTALATGYKTINGFVGLNRYEKEVKNLSELAMELGLSVAVMSTEKATGATPSDFSVHLNDRYGDVDSLLKDFKGLMVNPDTNYSDYTEAEWNDAWEPKVKSALNQVAADPDGFFIMYEEAFIDKNCHYGKPEEVFKTMYRFNQAIGIFMEYAMYNPDTFVLITADHETGGIEINGKTVSFTEKNPPDEAAGNYKYNHSLLDVPVFAYGFGAEVFATDVEKGEYYENASIGRTYAHFMTNGHADDFGDPWYPILVDGTTLVEYPDDPLTVKNSETLNEINISGKVTGSYSQSVSGGSPATITINLTNNGKPTNIKKMIISAANTTSAAPATTIVEAQVEVDGKLEWLQIYKDTLYTDAKQTGVLDFHTFYNAYQIKISVNSLNSTSAYYGTMQLTDIKLYGYDVFTPDVGGVVTSDGDANENAVVKLMKGDRVAYTATVTGNSYYVKNVSDGDYTVVATKNGHITAEYDITVKGKPVRQDVALKYVSTQASVGVSQSVRLIEPWAMRNFIQFGTKEDPIYLTSILGYGAYAVIEHKAGEAAPDSWDDIVYNDKAIQFEKSFTDGDEKISHTSLNGRNRRYNVLFDFYDMLYTYRMAEQVYWVAFYEDAEGIHFTQVCNISMSELIDEIIEDADPSETEKTVLNDMKTLHKELLEFRGPNANLGNTPYPEGVKLSDSDIAFEDINIGEYQFGKKRQVRLIEPWGFKVTLRFKSMADKTILSDPHATAADYGMIFYHDKHRRHVENGMSYDEMLAQSDALVFSKGKHNMSVDKDAVLAVYTKDIYTYQLDSELYCLPFIKMGNQYYFPENAVCWNLLGEMIEIRDDTKDHTQAERDVFTAMVNLYYDVTKHLGYN